MDISSTGNRVALGTAALLPLLVGAAVLAAAGGLPLAAGPPAASTATTDVASTTSTGWGVSVWPPRPGLPLTQTDPTRSGTAPAVSVPVPAAPARPARPDLPGTLSLSVQRAPTTLYWPVPPITLGPVQRLTLTVGEGQGAPLPAGTGLPHLLCPGPTTPRAAYVIDSSSGTPLVRRVDLSGRIDVYYRYVSRSYRQTQPCA